MFHFNTATSLPLHEGAIVQLQVYLSRMERSYSYKFTSPGWSDRIATSLPLHEGAIVQLQVYLSRMERSYSYKFTSP
ncbi:hypothetical protein BaRGS_00033521 [Batillaria attramentaria]|uniref:Uncharacterized protein n=1 Tax=Batillaria attramentaria TaxID=370345 RepID=A0ABD0JL72_9CAEN